MSVTYALDNNMLSWVVKELASDGDRHLIEKAKSWLVDQESRGVRF